ncbi:hypothetical protein GIB67_013439, partial [Kingdonia uniflora]
MNDALMGILRDFCNPLYVYTNPFTKSHQVSEKDQFVVLGSDGLPDFFNNEEVVQLVHSFIHSNPFEDHAKYLVENKLLETQHRRVYANPCWEEEKISRRCHGRCNHPGNQHGLSFDFGELEEAIVFQGVQLRNAEARKSMPLFPYSFSDVYLLSTTNSPKKAEIEIDLYQRVEYAHTSLRGSSRSVGESTDSGSAHNTLLELESPTSKRASNQSLEQKQQQLLVEMASDNTSITGPVQIQHFSTPEK